MRTWKLTVTAFLLAGLGAAAQQTSPSSQPVVQPAASQSAQPASPAPAQAQPASQTEGATQEQASGPATTLDQVVDRCIGREHALIAMLEHRNPLVETYLQNLKNDPQLGPTPISDRYFFGRMDMSTEVARRDFLSKGSLEKNLLGGFTNLFKMEYRPVGFSWMVFADRDAFDRAHYDFHYVHREFLGDVRTIVFDVTPKKDAGKGRFQGRIWVEDQDYNIVRLNGTYVPRPKNAYFFHMDSWRLNLVGSYWVPAFVYSEEGDFSYGSKDKVAFKAQTRIWGYDLKSSGKEDEMTQVLVDSAKDETPSTQDASPLQAEREWQKQAEDNVIERLERAGLLAPPGEVDKVLQTVVSNMEITNNVELVYPVRVRVMLTSPLETFSVGNTIVVSRGLIDVLPDEASLAMVLSHELAHIVLGHNLGSKFAFNDRMLFSDESTYQNFGFKHVPEEEAAADKKAVEMLKNSPYASKLETAGLFLKQLQERAPAISALLTAHLGNNLVDMQTGQVDRMTALMNEAPKLEPDKLDQIAALPLGGRVKVNPWNDTAELIKTAPVAITSARDKMPLEVTPFFPRLTRLGADSNDAGSTTASVTAPTH